ncbi:MAG TPA: PIN domain nuclease [Acidimicrobiales bacterium]|nr:PIN domain nuclease [Acidimicrobiales bacterium]
MALTAAYLADKSALARFRLPAVARRLRPLLEEGLVATCAVVDLEVLYSSRSLADYETVREERRSLEVAPVTAEVVERAVDLQHALARRGQHRVPIPDLMISAAAQGAGLTVLHYDADFERIAAAGGAPHQWVVPRGSLPS